MIFEQDWPSQFSAWVVCGWSLLSLLVIIVVVVVIIFLPIGTGLGRGGRGQTTVVRDVDDLGGGGQAGGGRGGGWGGSGREPGHRGAGRAEGGPPRRGEPGGSGRGLKGDGGERLLCEDLDPGGPLGLGLHGDGLDGEAGRQTGLWLGPHWLLGLRPGLGSAGTAAAAGAEPVGAGLGAVNDGLESGGRGPGLLPGRLSEGDLILGSGDLGGGPEDAVGVPDPVHAGSGPLDSLGLDWGGDVISVVIPALGDLLGPGALAVDAIAGAGAEHLAHGAAELPGLAVHAEEVEPAVGGVRVLGEGAGGGVSGTLELAALLVHHHHGGGALGHLVSPLAAPGHLVVGEAGGAVVSVCLAVLALPEHAAVLGVGEGPEQSGAVLGGDGGLQLGPLPALHQVQLGALLQGEGGVGVEEAQAIATCLQIRRPVLTMPVLVTAKM